MWHQYWLHNAAVCRSWNKTCTYTPCLQHYTAPVTTSYCTHSSRYPMHSFHTATSNSHHAQAPSHTTHTNIPARLVCTRRLWLLLRPMLFSAHMVTRYSVSASKPDTEASPWLALTWTLCTSFPSWAAMLTTCITGSSSVTSVFQPTVMESLLWSVGDAMRIGGRGTERVGGWKN